MLEVPNCTNGLAWFIHCSDIHIGKYPYLADYAKSFFDEIVNDLVKPQMVINSGDSIDGYKLLTSIDATSDWKLYQKAIYRPEWKPCEQILDLRGNHDALGITDFFTDKDPYSTYASCGFERKHVYSRTYSIEYDQDKTPDPGFDLQFNFFGGFNAKKTKSFTELSQMQQLEMELSKPEIQNSNLVFLVSHYNSPSLVIDTRRKIQQILKHGKLNGKDDQHRNNIWGFISGHFHIESMDTTRDGRRSVEAEVVQITKRVPFWLVKNSTHIRALIFSQRPIVQCWVDILSGVDKQTKSGSGRMPSYKVEEEKEQNNQNKKSHSNKQSKYRNIDKYKDRLLASINLTLTTEQQSDKQIPLYIGGWNPQQFSYDYMKSQDVKKINEGEDDVLKYKGKLQKVNTMILHQIHTHKFLLHQLAFGYCIISQRTTSCLK
ncbi:MAG: hypothetical protein EZS28_015911 [Streblomastix strix]|uniref:Calcineurin-like phosphoesterase domain-containing protein n=1 Tax=Streblomastix strix TaxID=222440 RepID=A0A5J4W270_9EUKA|nr:MAG: hypothetical protein EZS28_015911 [Streblomastix strix]